SAAILNGTQIVELRSRRFHGATAVGATGHRGPPSSRIDRTSVFSDPVDQRPLAVFSEDAPQAGATVADQRETDTMVFDQAREAVDGEDRVPARKAAQC